MRTIDMIVLHQTGTATGTVESIRRYHMEKLGWKDIGYHYVIYRDGSVHKARPNGQVGSHCKGDNAGSLGVCCVGAGDGLPVGAGYLTDKQRKVLLSLVEQLARAYRVPIARIVGHRERPSGKRQGKSCPGYEAETVREELKKRGLR